MSPEQLEKLEQLAAIGCTLPEIAVSLNVSLDDLDSPECQQTIQRGHLKGRVLLRKAEFDAAKGGNLAMAANIARNLEDKPATQSTGYEAPRTLDAKKRAFLGALVAAAGNRSRAAQAVGLDRALHYRWLKSKEYEAAYAEACKHAADVLEDEGIRRAHEGCREPVFHQGIQCGEILRYSDSLWIQLMKAAKPDEYRERTELTGKDGGPLEVKSALPEWLLQELKQANVKANESAVAPPINPPHSDVESNS